MSVVHSERCGPYLPSRLQGKTYPICPIGGILVPLVGISIAAPTPSTGSEHERETPLPEITREPEIDTLGGGVMYELSSYYQMHKRPAGRVLLTNLAFVLIPYVNRVLK